MYMYDDRNGEGNEKENEIKEEKELPQQLEEDGSDDGDM